MRTRTSLGPVGLLAALFLFLLVTACGGSDDFIASPVITDMSVPTTAEVDSVALLAVTAIDPNGGNLSYAWSATAGTLANATSATPLWTAPAAAINDVDISVVVTNTARRRTSSTRSVDVIDSKPTVPVAVKAIIDAQCAGCHDPLPANHTGSRAIEQCGACHVPYGNVQNPVHDGDTEGCVNCHRTPAVTHFDLRDDDDQLVFKPDAELDCIGCHLDPDNQTHGHGRPALDTDEAIFASAQQGTLRAWIQPGGFMAKYVTDAEVTTITDWVDSFSEDRILGYEPYLDAARTADFKINGRGDQPEWDAAPEHVIQTEPTIYTAATQVKLKALYSDLWLYIRVEYDDDTLSMTRAGSWLLDEGAWRHPLAANDNDKQSEDRVAFLWDMNIDNFRDRYGCAIKCHGNVPGSACFTDIKGARGDIWHTKAARAMGVNHEEDSGDLTVDFATEAFEVTAGNASFVGFSDDKWLTSYMNLDDGYDTEDSGRRGDAGSSMYSHNRNATKTAPKFMQTTLASWSDAMVLTQDEVDDGLGNGDVIVADPDHLDYDAEAVAAAWENYDAWHAIVPERILRLPEGSRGNLEFGATWDNGVWVNEFKRLLDPDTDDDVIFETSGNTEYPFGVAVFDNCGRGEIPPGHTTYGDGQYQILRFR